MSGRRVIYVYTVLVRESEGKVQLVYLEVERYIKIFNVLIKKKGVKLWKGLYYFMTGSSGGSRKYSKELLDSRKTENFMTPLMAVKLLNKVSGPYRS
jgi:hypothetical protein